MIVFRSVLIISIVLSTACSMGAQWRFPEMVYLGPEEGLHGHVTNVVQDSTGFLYFGTNAGLYRYDGHIFEFFGHDPKDTSSIGTGDVNGLLAGHDGLIWVTLRHGGLNSFDPRTEKFNHYPFPSLSFRTIPSGHALLEDTNDILWVGGAHFRLFAFDRIQKKYKVYSPDWIDPVSHGGWLFIRSIYQDRRNDEILWLSVIDYPAQGGPTNADGIVSFNKRTGKFQNHPWYGEIEYMDEEEILWSTMWDKAITRFDPLREQFDTLNYHSLFQGKNVSAYSSDIHAYKNKLIISTPKTLLTYDEKNKKFEIIKTLPDENEYFISLNTDRDQNLWIGTNQGAYVLNPDAQHIRFFSLNQFGSNNRIYPGRLAYDESRHVLYLSASGNLNSKRLYKVTTDESKNEGSSYISTDFAILGIATDHENKLWVSGDGAFHQLEPASGKTIKKIIPPDDQPIPWLWNMKSSPDGWLGAIGIDEFIWFHETDHKLQRLKMEELPGSKYAKTFDNDFDGFSFGINNKAYLFSNEIFILNLLTGVANALKFDQAINPHFLHIQYAGEDQEGNVWVSSSELVGRFKLVADSLVMQDAFSLKDGLINPTASELHADATGRIWVFTNSGINCIDPKTREVRYFGTREGLPDPFIDPRQVISISDNRIATVNSNGVIVFNTTDLWNSATPTDVPVVIKRIRIEGEQYNSNHAINNLATLELKPTQKLVDIEFQGLSYPDDYRLEYSYRISGLHDGWISIGQNKLITLPLLAPGHYIFEVKTGKPGGHSPVKSLSIVVGTPFYQQGWFIVLACIMIVAITLLWLQWRVRRVKKMEAAKTEINKKMAELELTALRSQMNPHFMFNSLNSIKNYILQAKPELAAEYLSNFAHLIRMILHHSREKSITLQDEIETLLLYIELEQLRFEDGFEFSCIVDDGIRMDKIKIPPMLLQPYVENAIWHGLMHKKEKGHLMLQFSQKNHRINCVIDDDGVGRSVSQKMKSLSAVKYKSMGMGITNDRIEIMNKMDALGITSEVIDKKDAYGQAAGTKVIISIPSLNGEL